MALVSAAAAADDGARFFREQVRPILREACFECHSHQAERIRGGLVLDSRTGVMAGGDGGAVVVPGDPDRSRLVESVRHESSDLQMPSKRSRLPASQIAVLEEWVRRGVPWDDDGTPAAATPQARPRGVITDEDRNWWAFQPVKAPAPPQVSGDTWSRNPVDRFLRERMSREGIRPSPPAAPAAFIRRVTFDLTGLPPTPEEVAAFTQAAARDRDRAVVDLVDRLLASPRYGERWARVWLDLVRYAESDGYRVDDYRPHVWRYRDWVIRALNEDLPYDRFVTAQLAGDEVWPEDPESARVATAFLRHWIYEYNNRDVRGQWQTILNDLTDVTGDLFLGLGVQCARCHDHKFDPILQRDYFRLQAFFAPLLPREDLPVATASEEAAHAVRMAAWRDGAGAALQELEHFERPVRKRAAAMATAKFPEDIQRILGMPASDRTLLERQLAAMAGRQITYEWARLSVHLKKEEKEPYEALQRQVKAAALQRPDPLPLAFTVTDLGPEAPPVFLPKSRDGAPVAPGFLSVLDPAPAAIERLPQSPGSTGRRAALARWLVSPENPLTARVMVNRVWQQHFGRGLAANASDFGRLGERPTHPELLDWLAARFVSDGWSLKQLHRWILTSAAYGQSASEASSSAVDPENRWLGRFPTRRLEAEVIRDALLEVTGELDPAAGGPASDAARQRRSVYTRVTRNVRDPLLEVFDAPDSFSSVSQRNVTTTPTQALLLINQPSMIQRSRAFARRLVREAGDSDAARVARAWELAFGRPAAPGEMERALAFLKSQPERIPTEPPREAPLVAEKMPYREGRAAVLEPGSAQDSLKIPADPSWPREAFTVEGFVQLRSAPDAGSHRIIAARWDGDPSHPGWMLAAAGKGASVVPNALVFRWNRPSFQGRMDEVSPGIGLELNKPYYVAVSVEARDGSPVAFTFVVREVANDCEPPRVVTGNGPGPVDVRPDTPLTLGGCGIRGRVGWDGLLDEIRFSAGALAAEQLLLHGDATPPGCLGWWRFEAAPGPYRDASPAGRHIEPPRLPSADAIDPRTQALADLCHVLLNSNEFLYTD